MNKTSHQRSGQTASAAKQKQHQYSANRSAETAESADLVVIEHGISEDKLPKELLQTPRQYFKPADDQQFAQWPTVSGSVVALVLQYALTTEKVNASHLLFNNGARIVKVFRVGGDA